MEETKILGMIKNNPNIISTVENPTEEMKKLAVSKNGLVLEYIKNPTREIEELALENKKKPGNPLAKYSKRKNLTALEKLEYENMKLRIENELLKKGFLMKGDGSIVKFMK